MAGLTFLSLSAEGTQRQTACSLVKSMWLAGQGTGQGVRKSGLYSQLWHWLIGWPWPVTVPSMPVSRKQGYNDNPQKGMFEQFLGIWGSILWGLRQVKMVRIPRWIFLLREAWLRAFDNPPGLLAPTFDILFKNSHISEATLSPSKISYCWILWVFLKTI